MKSPTSHRLLKHLLACGVLLALGGCGEDRVVNKVPTLSVSRSEVFVRRVSAEGYLKATEATPVTAPVDSQQPMKVAWVAEDGTQVAEGDVVMRFDPSEMRRQLLDSQGAVDSAALSMRKERALGSSALTKRDQAATQADKEIANATQFEPTENSILPRNDLIDSQIDIELAVAKAEHAREVKKVERAVSKSKVDLHRISHRQAQSEVKRAQDGLAKLEVTAPHAGIWVLERNWRGQTTRVGDTVWPGMKIAEIPLVTNMEAELFALEADAGDLTEELRAEVVIEAHAGRVYPASVKRVDALAQPRHHDVPVQYFGVALKFEQTDPETMKIGQRVRATIFIEQKDVIVVPRQSVFEDAGRYFIQRATDGGFEEVDVELGSSSAGRVVIAKGLEPEDRIALRDPNKAADQLLEDAAGAETKGENSPAPGGDGS